LLKLKDETTNAKVALNKDLGSWFFLLCT
jgi:hypothetical protein